MSRIRSIKPEFPQSESMGRVSRDARLLFVNLWTLADDSGRLRGASRMLASLLFPYDDDAPKLITGWLGELEREKCILPYQVDGQSYLQIVNWRSHQKIDKPSPSKIPAPREDSPNPRESSANPREHSSEDQGLDQGVEGIGGDAAPERLTDTRGGFEGTSETPLPLATSSPPETKRFRPPTVDEVRLYCDERGNSVDPEKFVDFYASKGWKVGKAPMKDWQASVRTWEKGERREPRAPQRAETRAAAPDPGMAEIVARHYQELGEGA